MQPWGLGDFLQELLGFLAHRQPQATWRGHGPELKG